MRIQPEALSDDERARYEAARRRPSGRPHVPTVHLPDVTPTRGPLALVLVVGGVGLALLGLGPVAVLAGAGAAAVGGYLVGRSVGATPASLERERGFLFAERQELTRAALAVASLRGDDGRAVRPQPRQDQPEPVQPGIPGPAYLASRRAALRAIDPASAEPEVESLEPDADAGVLGG